MAAGVCLFACVYLRHWVFLPPSFICWWVISSTWTKIFYYWAFDELVAPWVYGHSVLHSKVRMSALGAHLILMSHFSLLCHLSKVPTNWKLILLLKLPKVCNRCICRTCRQEISWFCSVLSNRLIGQMTWYAVTIFKIWFCMLCLMQSILLFLKQKRPTCLDLWLIRASLSWGKCWKKGAFVVWGSLICTRACYGSRALIYVDEKEEKTKEKGEEGQR